MIAEERLDALIDEIEVLRAEIRRLEWAADRGDFVIGRDEYLRLLESERELRRLKGES